ncbi:ATP-binding protein, partial [Thioclava sp. BHET1]
MLRDRAMPEARLRLRFESDALQIRQCLSRVMREMAPFQAAGQAQASKPMSGRSDSLSDRPADLLSNPPTSALSNPSSDPLVGDNEARCLDSAGVELVLAEVLNNISEHAYPAGPGVVELLVRRDKAALECRVRDWGRP